MRSALFLLFALAPVGGILLSAGCFALLFFYPGKFVLPQGVRMLVLLTVPQGYVLWRAFPLAGTAACLLFLFCQVLPAKEKEPVSALRLKYCLHGVCIARCFLLALPVTAGCQFLLYCMKVPLCRESILFALFALAVLLFNGLMGVCMTSVQAGVRYRILCFISLFILPLLPFALFCTVKVASREIVFESRKHFLNEARFSQALCRTRYPVLLVHGVFFRDFKRFNYWGRIPQELIKNGATVYYGNHQSARSVEDSAAEIEERIRNIVQQTGCRKVNIIAHSKGGLDCRLALTDRDTALRVASLITVSTPHRGCAFADYLFKHVAPFRQKKIAAAYERAATKMGDTEPDFLAAVQDLTAARCLQRDERTPFPPEVYCASVGSRLSCKRAGGFPIGLSYGLIRFLDAPNDGLVTEDAFAWGKEHIYLVSGGKRGISHADMIDLTRRNLPHFDVREFYVQLVHGLKERGL